MGFRFRRTLGETLKHDDRRKLFERSTYERFCETKPFEMVADSLTQPDDPQVLWWQCVMFQSNLCEYSGTFTPWREQGLLVKPKSSFFDTLLFS